MRSAVPPSRLPPRRLARVGRGERAARGPPPSQPSGWVGIFREGSHKGCEALHGGLGTNGAFNNGNRISKAPKGPLPRDTCDCFMRFMNALHRQVCDKWMRSAVPPSRLPSLCLIRGGRGGRAARGPPRFTAARHGQRPPHSVTDTATSLQMRSTSTTAHVLRGRTRPQAYLQRHSTY